jgi:hypothetical protein
VSGRINDLHEIAFGRDQQLLQGSCRGRRAVRNTSPHTYKERVKSVVRRQRRICLWSLSTRSEAIKIGSCAYPFHAIDAGQIASKERAAACGALSRATRKVIAPDCWSSADAMSVDLEYACRSQLKWKCDCVGWVLWCGRRRRGRAIPDDQQPGLYRSVKSGGRLSDIASLSWSKDAVLAADLEGRLP